MKLKSRTIDTEEILKIVKNLSSEVKTLRGSLDKQKKLEELYKKNPNIIGDILLLTHSDDYQYNLTPANIKKFSKNKKYDEIKYTEYKHLYDLLLDLNKRVITGHTALKSTGEFIKKYKKYEDTLFMILKKNLEMRLNAKSINKVIPKLITEFKVALANKFNEKYLEKYADDDWFISRKYDGVRIIAKVNLKNKTIKYFSRIGRENKLLDFLTNSIDFDKLTKNAELNEFILDGEIIYMDNKEEDFKKIMEVIKNPERDQSKLKYIVFDLLTVQEFEKASGKTKLNVRMENVIKYLGKKNGLFYPIKQVLYTPENLVMMNKKVKKNNWEGLMLRRNIGYEGKRSNNLLKVKIFEDAEFKVLEILPAEIRFINKKTNKEEKIMTLSSVVIDFNGVKVGSGFSEEQRRYYYEHPEELIGKTITVQYFEKTKDNKLRFPTLKYIHGDKREY